MKKILSFPNQMLTTPTFQVLVELLADGEDTRTEAEIREMIETLSVTPNGIALAANQLGFNQRMFVIKPQHASTFGLPEVVLNPIWSAMNEVSRDEPEGCLSFPGLTLGVDRWSHINCSFDTPDGLHHHVLLSDFAARVFQHECEHLSGETFLENVPRVKRFQIMSQFRKRKGG